MYTLDLICDRNHTFEAWFTNRAAFEKQRDAHLINCPSCESTKVKQTIAAVRIKKHAEEKPAISKGEKAGSTILQYIEKHFEDVGKEFADEAIKIHYGEAKHRNIRGTATSDEEKTLTDEGISFFKVPEFQ